MTIYQNFKKIVDNFLNKEKRVMKSNLTHIRKLSTQIHEVNKKLNDKMLTKVQENNINIEKRKLITEFKILTNEIIPTITKQEQDQFLKENNMKMKKLRKSI